MSAYYQRRNSSSLGAGFALGYLTSAAVQKSFDSNNTLSHKSFSPSDFDNLSKEEARELLPLLLNKAEIPHGDMTIEVDKEKYSSGRIFLSQWQRVASGSVTTVLGRDQDGDLAVAFGVQKNHQKTLVTRHPQGYAEAPSPKEDLTGLQKQNATRIHAKTGEPVPADASLEETAAREIKEELNLDVKPENLHFMGVNQYTVPANINQPVALEANYSVLVEGTPDLKVIDDEFPDDISNPKWYKIKDIYQAEDGKYYVENSPHPVEKPELVKEAVVLHGNPKDVINAFGDNKLLANVEEFKAIHQKITRNTPQTSIEDISEQPTKNIHRARLRNQLQESQPMLIRS